MIILIVFVYLRQVIDFRRRCYPLLKEAALEKFSILELVDEENGLMKVR